MKTVSQLSPVPEPLIEGNYEGNSLCMRGDDFRDRVTDHKVAQITHVKLCKANRSLNEFASLHTIAILGSWLMCLVNLGCRAGNGRMKARMEPTSGVG